ncbi:hypothetical protein AXG93_1928s1010 [Marchantia polymorpha subsp. ruderalis]|uniref:Uncharacterized protein n=1 Tax=Marchantia polymorpha subsp. ruderalis TaxID=1480154 RepID=A0A176WD05_MARPO|nr:hypothetical protein AXG93_1928s1010 [Marchantia polymorpha subsp. ruderalis]
MNKNKTEGEDLRGKPMLWTIEHWAKVMGQCAGSDWDLLFEKSSVGLTRIEEFSYEPLFSSKRQGTNGWKTTDYQDLKRRVGGTVVDAADIILPSSPVEDVRPEEEKKTSGEEVKTLEVTFPDFLQDSVVPLLKYLERKREKYDVSKEVGFYV